MKTLWFLVLVVFMSSCKVCLFAQIPAQVVYANANCQAVLPDYTKIVEKYIVGGCSGRTLTQTPQTFNFSLTNKVTTVTLTVTGTNGKSSKAVFNVTMADTITPRFMPVPELEANAWEYINHMYDLADKSVVAKMEEFDANFPYEQWGIPRSDLDSTYYKYRMIVYSDPGRAITGHGLRMWTFQNADTLIFRK